MAELLVVETISEVKKWRQAVREDGQRVGFVPTMGGLHRGHGSLIERSAAECDKTAVSIFVNPLQFGAGEDFERYPRTLDADLEICRSSGADLVLVGDRRDLYPRGFETHVEPGPLSEVLCGKSRPGHFRGVLTVVAKLLGIFEPARAYFGRKDFQQCVLVSRMVEDLNVPAEIVTCETVREPDGLAMSTRNRYLKGDDRKRALCLWRAIEAVREAFAEGMRDAGRLQQIGLDVIVETPEARLDYLELVDSGTLRRPDAVTDETVVAVAVYLGGARLIDNAVIG